MAILFITSRGATYPELEAQLDGAHELVFARDVAAARAEVGRGEWALVVVDQELTEDAATELIQAVSPTPVVLVHAKPTLRFTLAALRAGARDVLTRPLSAARLLELATPPGPAARLEPAATATESVIGESPAMLDAFRSAVRASASELPVLIVGETGTGKELLARVIHENSARAAGPFVTVNCAAIPAHLLESELFGHEAGALADTFGRRIGRMQRADGGTLFLDEVGSLALPLQARLVRLLQTSQAEAIGAESAQALDVRLIAATHVPLDESVGRQRFRPDLYYALAGVRMDLPPLRERGRDIELLAAHFVAELSAEARRSVRRIEPAALERLRRFSWPGNLRQLRAVLARAVMVADGETLRISHLPAEIVGAPPRSRAPSGEFIPLAELERRHIEEALALTGGHLGQAARLLGIHRNTLRRKLEAYQLPQK